MGDKAMGAMQQEDLSILLSPSLFFYHYFYYYFFFLHQRSCDRQFDIFSTMKNFKAHLISSHLEVTYIKEVLLMLVQFSKSSNPVC